VDIKTKELLEANRLKKELEKTCNSIFIFESGLKLVRPSINTFIEKLGLENMVLVEELNNSFKWNPSKYRSLRMEEQSEYYNLWIKKKIVYSIVLKDGENTYTIKTNKIIALYLASIGIEAKKLDNYKL
jgi:hypothetical protein